jgi:hypothetical protein
MQKKSEEKFSNSAGINGGSEFKINKEVLVLWDITKKSALIVGSSPRNENHNADIYHDFRTDNEIDEDEEDNISLWANLDETKLVALIDGYFNAYTQNGDEYYFLQKWPNDVQEKGIKAFKSWLTET